MKGKKVLSTIIVPIDKTIQKGNNAKNLHNEDEVTIKETGEHMCVLDAYVNPNNPKQVLIECDDGNTYTHHEIK